ncbi:hypothetical protein FA15DRAFT_653516 [Coprinopsis marcescibilis]|uniref:Uncharacterized protein n=1 Tax=Coprinopsis marcescibilis TaxID=230819 RepID=A0A5C3L4K9_COPMA|nr:hypothetical protein FA15DRAFT_653516 [Coprinopsis marcescibilis]
MSTNVSFATQMLQHYIIPPLNLQCPYGHKVMDTIFLTGENYGMRQTKCKNEKGKTCCMAITRQLGEEEISKLKALVNKLYNTLGEMREIAIGKPPGNVVGTKRPPPTDADYECDLAEVDRRYHKKARHNAGDIVEKPIDLSKVASKAGPSTLKDDSVKPEPFKQSRWSYRRDP